MSAAVLIVEDDPKTADLVRLYLEREGFTAHIARDGRDALELARRTRPAIVLLDVMLPGLDGLEVCRLLRSDSDVGIIMVSARTTEPDILRGLELGADDYVSKPFRPRELVARVRALLRRKEPAERVEPMLLVCGPLVIDTRRHLVTVNGQDADLTRREFQLLVAMAREPGRAFTRGELLDSAFGYSFDGLERTVDAHIRNLRRKIEPDIVQPRYVETVYGVGYRFTEHANA
jgi:DNA-binding response OmpR family regulator